MIIVNLLMVTILILLTAFFVAAEFAIVKVRSTRIDYLIESKNKRAVYAKKLIDNMDGYLSACQLGITVTALGLGWLGEPTVMRLLGPLFDHLGLNTTITSILSFAIAFFAITYLHVVVGELAPKTIAIQKAETVILFLAKPLILFYKVMFPLIWLLNGSARHFIRLFGFTPVKEHEIAHSEEELRLIISDSFKSGEINQSEMTYVNNIFEFDERLAKEIMIPRTEMFCFFKDDSFEANVEVVHNGQFTRYPVADTDKDTIIGLVNLKDVFTGHFNKHKPISIEKYIRPIIHVSGATPIKQILLKMQKEHIHMAIVNDEYGGTAGLITVEDILEEIVGEIQDEFDDNESPLILKQSNDIKIVSGKLPIEDINNLLDINLNDDEIDTIGGWVFMKNLDVVKGTTIEHAQYQFIVEEIEGYQIKRIKIIKI